MQELPEYVADQGPPITKAGCFKMFEMAGDRDQANRFHLGKNILICCNKCIFGAQVTLMDSGKYCFVRFQSPELATRAISIFDDTEAWD